MGPRLRPPWARHCPGLYTLVREQPFFPLGVVSLCVLEKVWWQKEMAVPTRSNAPFLTTSTGCSSLLCQGLSSPHYRRQSRNLRAAVPVVQHGYFLKAFAEGEVNTGQITPIFEALSVLHSGCVGMLNPSWDLYPCDLIIFQSPSYKCHYITVTLGVQYMNLGMEVGHRHSTVVS